MDESLALVYSSEVLRLVQACSVLMQCRMILCLCSTGPALGAIRAHSADARLLLDSRGRAAAPPVALSPARVHRSRASAAHGALQDRAQGHRTAAVRATSRTAALDCSGTLVVLSLHRFHYKFGCADGSGRRVQYHSSAAARSAAGGERERGQQAIAAHTASEKVRFARATALIAVV